MIQGTFDERFGQVRAEFERGFTERGEVGASLAVTLDGRTDVDRPWQHRMVGEFAQ